MTAKNDNKAVQFIFLLLLLFMNINIRNFSKCVP